MTNPSSSESPPKRVQLGHGGGGTLQTELIEFVTKTVQRRRVADGVGLDEMDDGATIPLEGYDQEIVVTTDGHTVTPLEFPGGDLGKLAVCGTVNDLLMMGAKPIALMNSLIVEEGLEFEILGRIMNSFNTTAAAVPVAIIAGDTKVMPHGQLNQMIMATSGVGLRPRTRHIGDNLCKPGFDILINGTIGDHGAALMAARQGIALDTALQSDVAFLTDIAQAAISQGVVAMKDPTRGGVASALNEWAHKSNVGIVVDEETLPIRPEVRAIGGMLGLDPLEIANEGKALMCVDSEHSEALLQALRTTPLGRQAAVIAHTTAQKPGKVFLKTPIGAHRLIRMPINEPIPRVC